MTTKHWPQPEADDRSTIIEFIVSMSTTPSAVASVIDFFINICRPKSAPQSLTVAILGLSFYQWHNFIVSECVDDRRSRHRKENLGHYFGELIDLISLSPCSDCYIERTSLYPSSRPQVFRIQCTSGHHAQPYLNCPCHH